MNTQTSAALQAAIEARKTLEDKFRVANSGEFYFVAVFQSEDQRDDFLRKLGWTDLVNDRYLNGLEIARRLGVDLPPLEIKPMSLRGKKDRYKGMKFIE